MIVILGILVRNECNNRRATLAQIISISNEGGTRHVYNCSVQHYLASLSYEKRPTNAPLLTPQQKTQLLTWAHDVVNWILMNWQCNAVRCARISVIPGVVQASMKPWTPVIIETPYRLLVAS